MLTEFSQAQANWNDQISIGEIYLKYAQDLLKAYPPYVNYFEDSKKTLQECEKKNPRFYAFLKVCQSKPESGRQHLADLLMHPIQRLPRVILLLTDILKYTTREKPDHVDVGKLDTAVNKIKELNSKMDFAQFLNPNEKRINKFKLEEVSRELTWTLLKSIPAKSSSGFDNVPSKLMNNSANFLAAPLTSIINKSFLEGKFPSMLKLSKINPVDKRKGSKCPANFRPIAMLSCFSKLIEKASIKQLV